jgi:hypothetical protein
MTCGATRTEPPSPSTPTSSRPALTPTWAPYAHDSAALIRPSASGPPAAISLSVRHVVGTDATGPNSSF